jgi:hypothetical protein
LIEYVEFSILGGMARSIRSLADHMDEHEETILALAKRLRVTWRTVRDAREGKLRDIEKAIELRDRILKLDKVRVSLASMLARDVVAAAEQVVDQKRAAAG